MIFQYSKTPISLHLIIATKSIIISFYDNSNLFTMYITCVMYSYLVFTFYKQPIISIINSILHNCVHRNGYKPEIKKKSFGPVNTLKQAIMEINTLLHVRRIISYKSLLFDTCNLWKMNKMYAGVGNLSIATNTVKEEKINVNGIDINYVKTGNGHHPVLFLPGALGTVWTDFKPQLDNLDKTMLTLVAWDAPGYGKSRPPDKTFQDGYLEYDANYAYELMKKLGYSKFSLVGWSEGGIISMILAAKYPESIKKLIIIASHSYILLKEIKTYESIMNIDTWSEQMRAPLVAVYGKDYLRKAWKEWVAAMIKIYKEKDGEVCDKYIRSIKSPTLIIHGKQDVIAAPEHPIHLHKNIQNSKLEMMEKGAHNLHLKYHEVTNKLIMEFLMEQNSVIN